MPRRFMRLWAMAAAMVLVVAACGDDDDTTASSGDDTDQTTTSAEGADGPQTLVVGVDANSDEFEMATLAYFPNAVTARPGDTIEFESVWTGEPHTVTFGTLVDEGLAAADPEAEEEPEQLAQIPPLLPEGPGDAIQTVGQPCFLGADEEVPADGAACSEQQQEQPAFDGTASLFNSGLLLEGDTFSVELAEDLEPGTYSYFCTLHRGGMTGSVTVVGEGEESDSAADVETARAAAEDELEAALVPVAEAVAAGSLPGLIEGGPGQVIGGAGSEEFPAGLVVSFGPKDVSVAAGESVTWTIIGPHTVSFGASEAERAAVFRSPDGSVHVNPDSFGPAGGEGQPAPTEDPPGPPIAIDGGSYDGSGFRNSGLILSFPPQLYSYSLTFTEPGTYEYFCLIHPEMIGTVTVT